MRSVLLALGLVVAACSESKPAPAPSSPPPRHSTATAAEHAHATPLSHGAHDLGGHKEGAHTDHEPRHGGIVLMDGDLHFEVVLDRGGRHAVYFSDAVRGELPASFATSVSMTVRRKEGPEILKLSPDPTGRFWQAQGRPIDDPDTVVRVEYDAVGKKKPYWIDIRMKDAVAGRVETGPNGGLVQDTALGRIELVVSRSGTFRAWLLDAGGKPRGVSGVKARVKVSIPGYPEVALAPIGDRLEGQGPALEVDHATCVIIVESVGSTGTGRFSLHLETGERAHP